MKNGETFECFIENVKGMPENPLTPEELTAKFQQLASHTFSLGEIQEIIHIIEHLEQLEDANELCTLLRMTS